MDVLLIRPVNSFALGNVSQQAGNKEKSLCQSLNAKVRGGLASNYMDSHPNRNKLHGQPT